MRIGFFDSGLGGLTILYAVRKHLPTYDYVYYGDTKNLPYGNKTETEIYALTKGGVEELFNEGAVLVIVACNTSSVASVRRLQDSLIAHTYPDRRILGVIIPTVETIVARQTHSALLIGTTRTAESGKYEMELAKQSRVHTIVAKATPTLVPLIEEGNLDGACKAACTIIEETNKLFETIVLGCTHYTLIKKCLRERYPHLTIISQDEIIPKKLEAYLGKHPEIDKKLTKEGSVKVILSAEMPQYELIKKKLMWHLDDKL